MTDAPHCDVFLSYSSGDSPWVREFAAALRETGLKGWFDAHDVDFGGDWVDAMEHALRTSRAWVVVLTPDSADSPWTYFELGVAIAGDKQIVSVLAEEMPLSELPPFVRKHPLVQESSPRVAAQKVATILQPTCV
jgi:hypothetical protein